MSSHIDERVVEMKFNNEQFERNIKESTKSLDNFKKSLDFKGDTQGFKEIQNAANGLNFNGIESALKNVSNGFSFFRVAAYSAIDAVVKRATNASFDLAKSLSIDQLTSGWNKYAEKTKAIQTIMGSTANLVGKGKRWENEEEQLEGVTKELQKLNWFADETSYSLIDMTSNVGKFTAQGVSLEDSTTAITGVSLAAAAAGQSVQNATRAMYNFSQAMGVGAMKRVDWKTMQNLTMATEEFKNQAINIALAEGTITKLKNGSYKTAGKKGATFTSTTGFDDSLTKGWMDKKVMLGVLETYGAFSDKLYDTVDAYNTNATTFQRYVKNYREGTLNLAEAAKHFGTTEEEFEERMLKLTTSSKLEEYANKFNLSVKDLGHGYKEYMAGTKSASEVAKDLGITGKKNIEAFGKALRRMAAYDMSIGIKAFQMGQEAKTFREAIDAVKDAASSAWADVFQTIFGDYLTARKLWTGLTEDLYTIFVDPVHDLNDYLIPVFNNFRKTGGLDYIVNGMRSLSDVIYEVSSVIQKSFLDKFLSKNGALLSWSAYKFKVFADSLHPSEHTLENIKRISDGIFSTFKTIFKIVGSIVKVAAKLGESILFNPGGLMDLGGNLGFIVDKINGIIEKTEIIQNIFNKVGDFFGEIIGGITDGLFELFGVIDEDHGFDKLEENISSISEKIKNFKIPPEVREFFKNTVLTIAKVLKTIWGWLGKIKEKMQPIFDFFKTNIGPFFNNLINRIKELFGSFIPEGKPGGFLDFINDFFSVKKTEDSIDNIFSRLWTFISGKISKLTNNIKWLFTVDGDDGLTPFTRFFVTLYNIVKEKIKPFLEQFRPLVDELVELWNKFKNWLFGVGSAKSYIDKIVDFLSKITPEMWKKIILFSVIVAVAISIYNLVNKSLSIAKTAVTGFANLTKALNNAALGFIEFGRAAKYEAIKGVINSISILFGAITAAVLIFSAIPGEKLLKGLAAVVIIGIVTTGILLTATALAKSIGKFNPNDIPKMSSMATFIIALAIILKVITKAIVELGSMDPNELLRGGEAAAAVLVFIAVFIRALSNPLLLQGTEVLRAIAKSFRKMAGSILLIALAMLSIAGAITLIGLIPAYFLLKGMAVMITLMTVITVMSLLTNISSIGLKKPNQLAINMLGITGAILLMATAIIALNHFKLNTFKEVLKILGILGVIFIGLLGAAVAVEYLAKASTPAKMRAGTNMILSIAGSIAIIVLSMAILKKAGAGEFKEMSGILAGIGISILGLLVLGGLIAIMASDKNLSAKKLEKAAGTMLTLSATLIVVATAIAILSTIPADKNLTGKVIMLGALFLEMGGIITLITSFKAATPAKIKAVGQSMLSLSGVIAILAGVLFVLQLISWDTDLIASVLWVGIILGEMGLILYSIMKIPTVTPAKLKAVGTTMLSMAGVMAAITALFYVLKGVKFTKDLGISLLSVAGLLIIMGGVIAAISAIKQAKADKITAIGLSMLMLSGVLAIITGVIYLLQGMPYDDQLKWKVIMLGGLFAELAIALGILSSLKSAAGLNMIKVGASIAIVAASLGILAGVLLLMKGVEWQQIGQLGAVFGGLAAGLALLSLIGPGLLIAASSIMVVSVAILAIAAAGFVFASAASIIINSIISMGEAWRDNSNNIADAIMFLISIIPQLGTAIGEGIANIIIALADSAPKLAISAMKLGLVMIEGLSYAITVGAPKIIKAILTFLIQLIFMIGEMAPAFVAAFKKLIIASVNGLVDLIPLLMEAGNKLGLAIIGGIAKSFGDTFHIGALANFGDKLLNEAKMVDTSGIGDIIGGDVLDSLNGISDIIDPQAEAIGESTISSLQTGIDTAIEKNGGEGGMLDKIAGFFTGDGTENSLQSKILGSFEGMDFSSIGESSGSSFLSSFGSSLVGDERSGGEGGIKSTITNLFSGVDTSAAAEETADNYVTSLDTAIEEKKTPLKDKILSVFASIPSENEAEFNGIGGKIAEFIIAGLPGHPDTVIPKGVEGLSNVISKIADGTEETATVEGEEIGGELDTAIAAGISNNANSAKVETAAKTTATEGATAAKSKQVIDEYKTAGENGSKGLASGILRGKNSVVRAAESVARAAVTASKRILEEKSPSRVFRKIGAYMDEGWALGIKDEAAAVVDTVTSVGHNVISAAEKAFNGQTLSYGVNAIADDTKFKMESLAQLLSTLATEDINTEPVIRPVIDLSDAKEKASMLNSMLGSSMSSTYGLANTANINAARATTARNSTTMSQQDNRTINIPINVYGTEGQDANEIANVVMSKMQVEVRKKVGVFS